VLGGGFQDTNAAQCQLVKLPAREHRNLTVVGDDDQAIYGWRGADPRHMLTFQRDFPGTTVVKLEHNYRSTQVILDAANGVIAENAARLGKTLFTTRPGGDPVIVLTTADERDEAQWLVQEFARVAAETDIAYEGMAFLYRTNAQSRPLEEALRYRGIPYRLVGAVSFYERREVKDLLAYLRLLVNPADDEAFLRVVNVPRRGIGDVVHQLVRSARGGAAAGRRHGRPDSGAPPQRADAFAGRSGLDDCRRGGAEAGRTALEAIMARIRAVPGRGGRVSSAWTTCRSSSRAGCQKRPRAEDGGGGRGEA
jgi:hypothetical protein